MRKFIVAALLAGSTVACANPNAPSYTCSTQPREYDTLKKVLVEVHDPDGSSHFEEQLHWYGEWVIDTYTQSTPCPATPIA